MHHLEGGNPQDVREVPHHARPVRVGPAQQPLHVCTKTGPPAPSAVFSLAYANALLAYSIFSAVCVQIFFASSKKKKAAEAEAAATETPATVHPAPGELKVGP